MTAKSQAQFDIEALKRAFEAHQVDKVLESPAIWTTLR